MRSLHRPFSPVTRPTPRRRAAILILALLATAACAQERPAIVEQPVEVQSIRLELPEGVHSLDGSSLRWLAGFDLEGSHERFGGFSGLLIDGADLLAISDRGWWWRGRLRLDGSGVLLGAEGDAMWPILDLDGGAVVGRDRHDAEELARFAGDLIVTFEGEHRLHAYMADDSHGAPRPSAELPRLLVGPPMEGIDDNGGLEAVTTLEDGRLLALTEDGRDDAGQIRAFIGSSEPDGLVWTEITVEATEDFKPTAAATLPGGDVLLVERSFHPLRGVRIRLSRIRLADLEKKADELIVTEQLGRLVPPVPVDNIEAVDVAEHGGRTLIYLLADDNFRSLQDTLLIQLELVEASVAAESARQPSG